MVAVVALVALTCIACVSDEYLGGKHDIRENGTISFAGGTDRMSRATQEGKDAAAALHDNFVVYGTKTTDAGQQVVYDHYNVNYVEDTEHSSESNTAGWEYVGQAPNALNAKLTGAETQDIKYWDMDAEQYDFVAFSTGGAAQVDPSVADGDVTSGVRFSTVDGENLTTAAYTLCGPTSDLTKVYLADRVTATKDATPMGNVLCRYRDAIKFEFRPLAAKVRIGLFETIPGYSVTDVKFYQQSGSVTSGATPYLYAGSETVPAGRGKINVSFPVDDKDEAGFNQVRVDYDIAGEKSESLELGALVANAAGEGAETGGDVYLGRMSSTASMTDDIEVLPVSPDELTLKIDFTLVSIDYNETINVKGAVATVPGKFTNWQKNHAYTYLFKISDAVTNAFGQMLYPVTFNALETVSENGVQQTISTVDIPSITTYAKGELGHEYFVGDHIYISVMNGAVKMLTADNSTLYKVSLTGSATESDVTETHVSEGMTGIDLIPVADGFMEFTDYIEAEDSPTGERIKALKDSNFAKFTAEEGIYVFRYKAAEAVNYTQSEIEAAEEGDDAYEKTTSDVKTPAEMHYKVIRIGTI